MSTISKTPYGTWRLRWREGGRQRSQTFPTRSEAVDARLRLRLGLRQERLPDLNLGALAGLYVQEFGLTGRRARAIRNVVLHVGPLIGDLPLSKVSVSHCEALVQALGRTSGRRGTLQPGTVQAIISLLRVILDFGAKRGYLSANPMLDVKGPTPQERPMAHWSEKERDVYWDYVSQRDRELADSVLFACHTGLRIGEQMVLAPLDIDLNTGLVKVSKTWDQDERRIMPWTKTRQIRHVPLNAVSRAIVVARMNQQLLFPDLMRIKTMATANLQKHCPGAGVPLIRWHDLRHTFATSLVLRGVPLSVVQKLLGHKTVQTTMRYLHVADADKVSAVEAIAAGVSGVCQVPRANVINLR